MPNVFEGNPASEKVLLEAGYKKEGTLRNAVFKEEKFMISIFMLY